MNDIQTKLASLAGMGMASFVAPKIAAAGWKMVTGKQPPSEEEGSKFAQILVFAVLSAVIVSTMQQITGKMTNKLTAKTQESTSAES